MAEEEKRKRGFAAMSREQLKEIASKGGKARGAIYQARRDLQSPRRPNAVE